MYQVDESWDRDEAAVRDQVARGEEIMWVHVDPVDGHLIQTPITPENVDQVMEDAHRMGHRLIEESAPEESLVPEE